MHFSITLVALVAPILVSAAPWRRAASTDLTILMFADVLEQLESTFYTQALQKFQDSDFQAAGFQSAQIPIQQFTQIESDEATHSMILQSTIKANGGQPITSCNFDFSSVLTDVSTMAATARLVENVGVGAYLGAAHLVSDPVLLTAAASILTVEARHQTVLNILGGATAIPQSFDIGLTPSQVLAIAGAFISGCDLGVSANPSLTITNTGALQPGTTLNFKSDAINGTISEDTMFCQMLAGGLAFSISLPFNQCTVPPGINGPVAIFVTSDDQPLAASVVDQATNSIVAGPTMGFIDIESDTLSQLVRTGSGTSSASASNSTSTTTISPSDASSIIFSASTASASATPAAAAASGTLSANAQGSQGSNAAASPPPNTATGPSPDGHVVVIGWSNLPSSTTTA
ncbi:hypothetical protein PILCRDRAFT_68951 [Piloderma croceum F 1598]|uniref:Ferritin-like domain-containing protein n=1 Tax=Piloderma croceum (strain F 1598) TaxID=765440 RepID=A0A0C3FWP6_PILCF|nr:hypothetical protein PILCRDRAFT_68951 [Piloderma croceum F 1598]